MTSLILICGPSGSGKTTLANMLVQKGASHIISTTTRPPRPGERYGVDYHFVDASRFNEDYQKNAFIETSMFNNNMYGTSFSSLHDALSAPVIVHVVDVVGYKSFMAAELTDINIKPVFITAQRDTLIQRLENRYGVDKAQDRIALLDEELNNAGLFSKNSNTLFLHNLSLSAMEDIANVSTVELK